MVDPSLLERRSLEAARQGDVAGFNRLVELYQRLAFNVAYRVLGNQDEAADATQDAFLSAYRAIGSFQGDNVRAWLLRIVVNACYDHLRRARRQRADSLEALSEAAETEVAPPDTTPGPEAVALTTETAEYIQAALDRLPDDQRAVVVLCDVHGLSYEEAAESLEVAIGTVKSRLSRARARLRDDLTRLGELPGASRRPSSEGLHS
ncbi:MAG: sigma-70 family RNA polymerase sigma factor [Chloroflexi bacterium]|nr:sigma-70 family RNA polymerase sigma factor [Chloroflexota bacterium]